MPATGHRKIATMLLIAFAAAAIMPATAETKKNKPKKGGKKTVEWKLSSDAFKEGQRIPDKYTCKGPDVSPALSWNDPPASTAQLALIMDDPDAPVGTWTHWILYNLDKSTRALPENVSKGKTAPEIGGARQGVTDFRRTGYGGPCPPPGKPHRYFFTLYALDKPLDIPPGASLEQVRSAIKGRVIAETKLMGAYSR